MKNRKPIIIMLVLLAALLALTGCHAPTENAPMPTQAPMEGKAAGEMDQSMEKPMEETKSMTYQSISQADAKAVMDSGKSVIILDVRTQAEYDESHIPGAVLIPHDQIAQRAESELTDKAQTLLVYCRSGNRSKAASQALAELGYTDVREFGGINTWSYGTEP